MLLKPGFFLVMCFAAAAGAQEQTTPRLTARELFYAAITAPAKSAPVKVRARAGAAGSPAKKPPIVETARADNTVSGGRIQSVELPDGTKIAPASTVTADAPLPPLGLRYTILKKSGSEMVEIPAETIFHASDRIEISVQANLPGYLYIVNRGSSGTWRAMFPSPELEDGNNHVEAFHDYILPPKARIVFDEQTGKEQLFIVFSREPEPSLEKLIYSLQKPGPAKAPQTEESAPQPKALLALANRKIDDATVGFLRTAYSRDLMVEHVDESTPGERKETAVYVVNPSGGSDARVVADIELVHQ